MRSGGGGSILPLPAAGGAAGAAVTPAPDAARPRPRPAFLEDGPPVEQTLPPAASADAAVSSSRASVDAKLRALDELARRGTISLEEYRYRQKELLRGY
jgi:hypothetical protein